MSYSIENRSESGKRYNLEYSERIGIEEGDTVLIEIIDDNWLYITNPETSKTANITSVR
jgi:hypothetical protein